MANAANEVDNAILHYGHSQLEVCLQNPPRALTEQIAELLNNEVVCNFLGDSLTLRESQNQIVVVDLRQWGPINDMLGTEGILGVIVVILSFFDLFNLLIGKAYHYFEFVATVISFVCLLLKVHSRYNHMHGSNQGTKWEYLSRWYLGADIVKVFVAFFSIVFWSIMHLPLGVKINGDQRTIEQILCVLLAVTSIVCKIALSANYDPMVDTCRVFRTWCRNLWVAIRTNLLALCRSFWPGRPALG